jgi:predicted Rossmann fold flavoprotein
LIGSGQIYIISSVSATGSVLTYDVIIIGAGAAGLFCAIEAGKRGRSVLLLDHNDRVGEKILISGGGRCNFTNIHSGPEHFISTNPHFCKSALARFGPVDIIRMVEQHGIAYYEKKDGQLFCRDSARQIVDMLVKDCADAGVVLQTGVRIESVGHEGEFVLATTDALFRSTSLVIATGGLSIPKLGSTGFGYDAATKFGHMIVEARPGLVPLTFDSEETKFYAALSGVSFEAVATTGRQSFRESVLATHRGLSGPAILQISSYLQPGGTISIDLLPDVDVGEEFRHLREANVTIEAWMQNHLPKRFARAWCGRYAPQSSISQISSAGLQRVERLLKGWEVTPSGTEGFGKAEVTVGGVDTVGLSSKTMESRHMPGLFFIGEVVDVTGHLGGHNFQWAWASGFAAGQSV